MNSISIVGHVGNEAELRHTQTGVAVASCSLASNDGPKDKQRTVWFRLNLWRELAEKLTPYLTKGTLVAVVGSIDMEPRVWVDKSGEHRAGIDVTVQRIRLLGGGQRDERDEMPTSVGSTEEIPF